MDCAHNSIETTMQHELKREDVENPFFQIVKIEDTCKTCRKVLFLVTGRENCIDYLKRRIKELELLI